MNVAKRFYKYEGLNPFSDNQARNFSDEKISREFFPVSSFWSLFNDQHEILIGSRGSGKTFLLKMMRRSMLKRIDSPEANNIVSEKKYLSLYVPMHLEFIGYIATPDLSPEQKQLSFLIAFNCLLAQSLLNEVNSILQDFDEEERVKKTISISSYLNKVWLNNNNNDININYLVSNIDSLYYSIGDNHSMDNIPNSFKKQLCAPLLAAKHKIEEVLELNNDPTWIICIDEAEFLDEEMQKIINSVFRSDSNKIAIKMATLPYRHTTLETIKPSIFVSNGNDFSYKVIDMSYDSLDFINLTNKLCSHRIKSRIDDGICIDTLEDFVGKVGNDDLIDYYRLDAGEESSSYDAIMNNIINSFSDKRRLNAPKYSNPRKTIYDKYAPIWFLRDIYAISKKGNNKASWYAGANNIRKVAQGNPRSYIKIMYDLFEMARKRSSFSQKSQHEVLYRFAVNTCEATKALGQTGPIIYHNLDLISSCIHSKVHNGNLVAIGSSFRFSDNKYIEKSETWLKEAIAHSRVIVSENEMIDFSLISHGTSLSLANIWAVAYWLPMRKDNPLEINDLDNIRLYETSHQISLFEDNTIKVYK